ncbi:MAG TPA: alpha/beta fold hydrolase [Dehalococcoidia bacterium]|nr:alpha/beta fold hydrolase [Dehalococcoidia bacterium]
MPYVKVNDINMYYEQHGQGKPLVLIPGIGSDSSNFAQVIPIFSQYYQVIAIDNRGAGKSDKPDYPYTIEMMADDLSGLLDELGIDKANVFGLSMGGGIAQEFALKYPEKVISLILGCTACGGSHAISLEGTATTLDSIGANTSLTPEERVKSVMSLLYTQDFMEKNPDLIKEIALQAKNPPDPTGWARQQEAISSADTYDRLPNITMPTLVIVGEEDKMIHPDNSRLLASRIPDSELAIIKNAGHALTVLEETQKTVLDFLDRFNAKK